MATISAQLPDYIAHGLSILFVGINPGLRSAEVGHHYAGPSNRFWKLLFDAGLIPHPLSCRDDWRLPEFGYGLTNVIPRPTAGSHQLGRKDFLLGRKGLERKIEEYEPKLVALLGVGMARMILENKESDGGQARSEHDKIQVGLQPHTFGRTRIFVLPNPSGRNAHYSYPTMKALFCELKQTVHE